MTEQYITHRTKIPKVRWACNELSVLGHCAKKPFLCAMLNVGSIPDLVLITLSLICDCVISMGNWKNYDIDRVHRLARDVT